MGNAMRHTSYTPSRVVIEETVLDCFKHGIPVKPKSGEVIHSHDLDEDYRTKLLAAYFRELKKRNQEEDLIETVVSSDDLIGTIINAASSNKIAEQNQLLIQVGRILIEGLFKRIQQRVDDDLADECAKYPAKLDRLMREEYED